MNNILYIPSLIIGQLCIFTIVPIVKAFLEARHDKTEKDKILKESNYTKSIEHKHSVLIRGIIFGSVALIVPYICYLEIYIWLFIIALIHQLSVFYLCFDTRLNYLDDKDLFYIGGTADTDIFMKEHVGEHGLMVLKLIGVVVTYYFLLLALILVSI